MAWSACVSIANSVLIWIFMARWRETEVLGKFTIVMSLYMLFFTICSLGLSPFIINETTRLQSSQNEAAKGFISTTAISLLVWGVVCALMMTLTGFAASSSFEVWISTAILSLAMIPTGVITASEAVSISFGRTRLIALVTTLENVLRTVIPLALIFFGYELPVIFASFVFVRLTAITIYAFAGRKLFSIFDFDRKVLRRIIKAAPTFATITILASLNWQILAILLGRFSTEIETAKYGVASRFLIPVMIVMASYASVIQPLIAQKLRDSETETGVLLSKVVRNVLLVATFAGIVSPFLATHVLTVLFGTTYADVAPILNVLALTVAPFCAVMIIARGLVAKNLQKVDLMANAVGVFISVALGSILVTRFGALGAATTQLVAFLTI
ncbi:MAG: oligosaccharide flippase family protein, partial [Pyrinomonadaceae bacterium]|nr:oligosaccharide flippase family protein [Pyrinomonadaceae bacterium]